MKKAILMMLLFTLTAITALAQTDKPTMFRQPELRTGSPGAAVKTPVGPEIPGHRFHQIVRAIRIFGSNVLLRFVPGTGQILIEERRAAVREVEKPVREVRGRDASVARAKKSYDLG